LNYFFYQNGYHNLILFPVAKDLLQISTVRLTSGAAFCAPLEETVMPSILEY